jgi:molecular chaperone DnaK
VAAALAYGFQSDREKVFWLVYDLGGGTFDSALIQMREGLISVINHAGDNHLGGKLLDWEIVDQLLIPALQAQHHLPDLRRGNPRWAGAIAQLKLRAEEAKIRLSRAESAEIVLDLVRGDGQAGALAFEYVLQRADVVRLSEPLLTRSINIAKKVIQEKRLGPGDIERVILVGGPTLMPHLRERLSDEKDGLGIPLEFKVDPLTIVARGAAVFAGTQRLDGVARPLPMSGAYALELEYKPMGADPEPLVGGRIVAPPGVDLAGHVIEFVNLESRPQWRSGRIGLAPNGTFMATLWAEKGRANTFQIELADAAGRRCEVAPASLAYTVAAVFTDPPLIHSVGIALANNETEWLLQKGTPLPARRRAILKAAVSIQRGSSGDVLRIPVVEGQNPRADRNQEIGRLVIRAQDLKRDIPAGSDIEVTVEVDTSRLVKTKAYVPILDEEFEQVITYESYGGQAKDPATLKLDAEKERERLAKAREKASQTGDGKARQALQRIDGEGIAHDVDAALAAASADRDAADKAQKRILDLRVAIDEVEDALEWPALVVQAEKELEEDRKILLDGEFKASADEKAAFARLERELRAGIQARDAEQVRLKITELDMLARAVLYRLPGFWVGQLRRLEAKRELMSDRGQADSYFSQGQRALQNNDVEGLRNAVVQLVTLLPPGDSDRVRIASDVIR